MGVLRIDMRCEKEYCGMPYAMLIMKLLGLSGPTLKQAAKQSNKDEIKRRIGELEDYVGRVKVDYE